MSRVLERRRVSELTVEDLQALIESLMREVLRDYEIRRREYFIDEEGYLCFYDEQAYAEYLEKQGNLPSEVKACFIEDGVKIVYSDEELLPETLAKLEEIHQQIEAGVPMTEHDALRKRLGV
jgi:uncharacterized protein with NAD-binding domain and iron-sulfur cluster